MLRFARYHIAVDRRAQMVGRPILVTNAVKSQPTPLVSDIWKGWDGVRRDAKSALLIRRQIPAALGFTAVRLLQYQTKVDFDRLLTESRYCRVPLSSRQAEFSDMVGT